jgi:hypothetical protein
MVCMGCRSQGGCCLRVFVGIHEYGVVCVWVCIQLQQLLLYFKGYGRQICVPLVNNHKVFLFSAYHKLHFSSASHTSISYILVKSNCFKSRLQSYQILFHLLLMKMHFSNYCKGFERSAQNI